MKKLFLLLLSMFALVAVVAYINHTSGGTPLVENTVETATIDERNIAYTIEGESVLLENGVSEMPAAPGSASMVTTRYFGNDVHGDISGDGKDDVVFLLTQDRGGSGTFYYVAAALGTDAGYVGTNAVFLGDRIAPQSTFYANGEVVVNYAERASGEAMSTSPSRGVSKMFTIQNGMLVELSPNER